MAIGSMIVQFEYDDEEIDTGTIERRIAKPIEALGIDIIHLEVASENLTDAFGVEGFDSDT